MKKNIACIAALALAASVALLASVTFDPNTGIGFVGKGDVQLVYGWNNKALQDNAASVEFRANSVVVTEVSWICVRGEEQTQERARTTTTSVQGLVDSIARERNQITGFILTGYNGEPTQSSETEGPALNSCPAAASGWVLGTPAGEPVVVSSSSTLQVSTNGSDWSDLQ